MPWCWSVYSTLLELSDPIERKGYYGARAAGYHALCPELSVVTL